MARPKGYSVPDVIERATHAFWEHGYQALGVRELADLTGLNQYAIRTEFGGKEGLYLAALDHYAGQAISKAMPPMQTGGVADIIAFLKGLVETGSMTSSRFGCLVVNTGIENARIGSARLEAAIEAYWRALSDHFRAALENDRALGNIPADTDIETVVQGLVSGVMGVHACNRVEGSNAAGKHLVTILITHLKALETT